MALNNSSLISLIFREKNSLYHTKAINSIIFNTPYSFYSGARDALIKEWSFDYDSNTIHHLRNYEDHFNWINDLALSKTNSLLFSCSNDQTICIWDTNNHILHNSIRNIHKDYITAIKYNDNKELLYSAGLDGYLYAITLETGFPYSTICDNQNESIYSIATDKNGNQILASKYNNNLVLYDTRSVKQSLSVLRGHKDIIRSVYMSPDGKNAISASSDKTIKIWDVSKAKVIQSFDFHSDSIMSLYVNDDFSRIISGSKNGEIFLIDLKRLIYSKLDQLPKGVLAIAMNPSESRLLFSSLDNKLYSYQIKKDPARQPSTRSNNDTTSVKATSKAKDKDKETLIPSNSIKFKEEQKRQSALIVKDEIIGYTLMKNKIYALLQYKDNSSAVFNLMKMKQISRLKDMPYAELTEKLKEVDKTTLKTWCTLDIKLGCLMMSITEDNYDSNSLNFDQDFIEKILEKEFVVNSETKFLLSEDDLNYSANNKKTAENIGRPNIPNRTQISASINQTNIKKSSLPNQPKGMNNLASQGNQATLSCGKHLLNKMVAIHLINYLSAVIPNYFHVKDARQFIKDHDFIIEDVDLNTQPVPYVVIINKQRTGHQISQFHLDNCKDLIRFPSFCYSNDHANIMKRLLLLEIKDNGNEHMKIVIDKSGFEVPYIDREDVQKANIASTVSVNKLKTFITDGLDKEKFKEHILKDLKETKLLKEQKELIENKYFDDKKLFIDLVLNGIKMKQTELTLKKIKHLLFPNEEIEVVVKYVAIKELIDRGVIKF